MKVVAAFETWTGGESALYLHSSEGGELDAFIRRHHDSGTFAELHTFSSEEDARETYLSYIESREI